MFQLLESLNMAKKALPTTYRSIESRKHERNSLVVSKPKLKAGSDFHSKGLRKGAVPKRRAWNVTPSVRVWS